MTWRELWIEVRRQCSCDAYADNIIGRLMDEYESWDWNDFAPEGALVVLKR